MNKIKERLDIYLVKNKFFVSRERAKAEIISGNILVNNNKINKAGTFISENSNITILKKNKYVSRGALKLEKAINIFNINLKNKIALDIGCSTGGFSEILLIKGVKKLFCVDVGYGQLAWKIRNNSKVTVLERTNARYSLFEKLNKILVNIITVDVSFISLSKIFYSIYECLKINGNVIALIKPQFETIRENLNSKGVVKKKVKIHFDIIKNIIEEALKNNFSVKNITYSPIKGPKGNIEYFILLKKEKNITNIINKKKINKIVNEAFTIL